MQVSAGQLVRIAVELRVKGGELIESSKRTGPVEYKHGTGQMLAGLEKQLEGLRAGDEKTGVIAAADAFGTAESQPKVIVPRSSFPVGTSVAVGAQFEAKGPQGTPVTLEILSADGDAIHTRVVHPLAGKDIEYAAKILGVRKAPPPVPKGGGAVELELEPDAD